MNKKRYKTTCREEVLNEIIANTHTTQTNQVWENQTTKIIWLSGESSCGRSL